MPLARNTLYLTTVSTTNLLSPDMRTKFFPEGSFVCRKYFRPSSFPKPHVKGPCRPLAGTLRLQSEYYGRVTRAVHRGGHAGRVCGGTQLRHCAHAKFCGGQAVWRCAVYQPRTSVRPNMGCHAPQSQRSSRSGWIAILPTCWPMSWFSMDLTGEMGAGGCMHVLTRWFNVHV